jgi:hypothetical protein
VADAPHRDGAEGFDFLIGTWHTEYKRLLHPLANDHQWYTCSGSSVVTRFWDGDGNIEDGDLRCPATGQYIRSVTVRLYNPASRQWSLYWGTKDRGLTMPAQVGRFSANGVGEFLADDTWEGKPIVVRYQWTLSSDGNPHFEQAFSPDSGKTWETNWICDYTRVSATDL